MIKNSIHITLRELDGFAIEFPFNFLFSKHILLSPLYLYLRELYSSSENTPTALLSKSHFIPSSISFISL